MHQYILVNYLLNGIFNNIYHHFNSYTITNDGS